MTKPELSDDYMITVCRDEFSARSGGTYITLPLHGGIKFHLDQAGQFPIFFWFPYVSMC